MADLEALERQKDYAEFLMHARDVRPSERGMTWLNMVADMAEGYIQSRLDTREFIPETLKEIEKLQEWPNLRHSEVFQFKRNQYVLAYLQAVPEARKEALDVLWNNSPQDLATTVELGAKISELLLSLGDAPPALSLWPYIQRATTGKYASIYCLRPSVRQISLARLLSVAPTLGEGPEARSRIDKELSPACQQAMLPELKTLMAGADKARRDLAFMLLDSRGQLSAVEREQYLVEFLLRGPVVGETFNQAWNLMKSLGQDFKHRQELLSKLATQDYLPDTLFAAADKKKRDVLLELFSKNFPEYLAHYARTCLDYYKGLRDYPEGNPTMHCKALKEAAKGTKLLSPTIQKDLSTLKL